MTTPGACILDADGLRLSADEKAFFRDADPWGFILFARNVEDPDQLRRLTGEMREAVGRDAVITVDQEGGRVQRLRPPHWRDWTPPLDFVTAAGPEAEAAMRLRSRIIARELRAVGIDSNCAPTCDVIRPETHPFLKNRCYGTDPLRVAAIARAVAEGMLAEGVLPVVKHMPGHGRATVDSHRDLPRVAAGRADLDASDFAVFRALADLPLGMTAHLVFEALAPEPATCSATMMRLIRDDIGFDGLMMTDDISMQALTGRPADRARAARAAGVDLVLYCNAPLAERVAVAAAAGSMDADGLRRADAALARRIAPASLDIGPLASELEALQGTRGHA